MEAPLKKILRAISLELRHTLEGTYTEDGTWNAGDLERRLNQIGIWWDRPVKPISEMPNLSPVDRKARELIDAYLALRSDAGVSPSDAVAEFVRESAYSWANRLFALRCLEARGIIDPVILQEETYHGRSMVHDRFAQINPTQCTEEDDGLFAMLSEQFRERSKELPDLFAPDSPAVALRPSVVALKHCIALLSGSIPANGGKATDEVFSAPDAFGWAYQYWNAEEKDRVFEMVRTKKGAKIEGSDIIPATQLYTEPYMVKFLVQNSLGATWMMMHPESKLSTTWEYYVKDADRTPNEKKSVAEITFLDPACGSGHFLIEAFDLLYAMYEEEGLLKEPAAICQSILNNNLFGIDIDERAVQITKAVLWMKAAETVFAKTKQQLAGDEFSEFHDHIIATNIRLPNGKDHLDTFLKKHPEDSPLRPALLTVFEGLQNVHELGSLVQIEEPVDKELKVLKEQAKQQRFDPESGEVVEKVNFPRWKQQVMKRLKAHFQDEAEKAIPTEAFFSQSAVKGLALFDLLARRYTIVTANPPYMSTKNMGSWIKSYVEFHYPEGKRDLYAAFILRNIQFTEKNGKVAMVTQQSWMFLQSFTNLRSKEIKNKKEQNKITFSGLLKQTTFETIVHLGPKAFGEISGEVVNICLFSLSNQNPSDSHIITAFRLVGAKDSDEKNTLLKLSILKPNQNIIYKCIQKSLLNIANTPLIYWISDDIINLFIQNSLYPPLSRWDHFHNGLTTGNNLRYLRYYGEITEWKKRWYPYSKGGSYCKWCGNINLFLEWESDGIRVKQNSSCCLRSNDRFFEPLLTYSLTSQGSLGVRFNQGKAFDNQSPPLFPSKDFFELSAVMNSRPATFLLRLLSPSMIFNAGYVSNLPIPFSYEKSPPIRLKIIAQLAYALKERINEFKIKEISFSPNFDKTNHEVLDLELYLLIVEGVLEKYCIDLYDFTKQTENIIFSETGYPAGFYPLIPGYDTLPKPQKEIFKLPLEVFDYLNEHNRTQFSLDAILKIKKHLRFLFELGPNTQDESEDNETNSLNNDEESLAMGAHIPIPAETFIEELSQKMEIHPISIYWLLKEGIEKEGWRCIPEEKRYTEDLLTVMILHLLSHRWPKQIEAGEQVPGWADPNGIIPITSGLARPTLLQQVRDRIVTEFPVGKIYEMEKEFEKVLGMNLERWLADEFFKHHISQFKKRPIAWQLSSSPSVAGPGKGKSRGSRKEPAFSCLVYYHKIDTDILHKIRTQYVGDLINRYGTELRSFDGRKDLTEDLATRKVQLENWIAELKDFSQALQDVADRGFDSKALKDIVETEPLDKWTSRDGKVPASKTKQELYAQEKRYDPDINDGVRVNIAPIQKAGLLAAEVIAKKDLEKAISDRAEWRADERRWCREGKLSKCGWWG